VPGLLFLYRQRVVLVDAEDKCQQVQSKMCIADQESFGAYPSQAWDDVGCLEIVVRNFKFKIELIKVLE